jgi:Sulfotransferase family
VTDTTRVVYVGGFGRSGSTLVERILGQLPGVCAVGEVVHLWQRGLVWDERCGCGESFSACPFWRQVGEMAFGGWDNVDADVVLDLGAHVDRTRYIPGLAAPRLAPRLARSARRYADYYAAVHSAVAAVSGASVVVDSSKNASLAYVLRCQPEPDLRVLHVVRDSRGVAYSWTKQVSRPEATEAHPEMLRYRPWRSAMLWDAQNASFTMLARIGTPTLRVHYERLLADPLGTMRRICAFLDLPGAELDAFLGPDSVKLAPAHTVSGNPMRFQTGTVPLRRDDAWRRQMRSADRRVVSALTLPLLLRYSYLRTRREA